MHKIQGVDYNDKPHVTRAKIIPKTAGKWPVSNAKSPDVDSNDLDLVFYPSSLLDIIQIAPGTYSVNNLDLDNPILIQGLTTNPQEVVLEIKSKSLIEMKTSQLKKLEGRNLTIKNKNKTYPGGFLSFRGVHAIFKIGK